jgi:hypothetical protein
MCGKFQRRQTTLLPSQLKFSIVPKKKKILINRWSQIPCLNYKQDIVLQCMLLMMQRKRSFDGEDGLLNFGTMEKPL